MRQSGFVLLPVILTIALLATLIYLMGFESSESAYYSEQRAYEVEQRYLVRAAAANAKWFVLNETSCNDYSDITQRQFGHHQYDIIFSELNGSLVDASILVRHRSGSSSTIDRTYIAYGPAKLKDLQYSDVRTNDATLNQFFSNNNYDSSVYLQLQNTTFSKKNTIQKFPLEQLIGQPLILNVAELELYYESFYLGPDVSVTAYPVSSSWAPDEVTWNEKIDGVSWITPGGEHINNGLNTALIDVGMPMWTSWDVKNYLKETLKGRSDYGFLLRAESSTMGLLADTLSFTSANSTTCQSRPKIALNYRCECNKTCSFVPKTPQVILSCNTDYTPDSTPEQTIDISDFDNVYGVSYIPTCTEIFDVVIPSSGALLLTDYGTNQYVLMDLSGNQLATRAAPVSNSISSTIILSGEKAGYIATTIPDEQAVYFLDESGNTNDSFSTTAFTTSPTGITSIYSSQSGAYDNYIAITSDKNHTGNTVPTLAIVDQAGNLETTIVLDAVFSDPSGISHIVGEDKFLITESTTDTVYKVDFSGNVLADYSIAQNPKGVTMTLGDCKTIVNDSTNQQLKFFGD